MGLTSEQKHVLKTVLQVVNATAPPKYRGRIRKAAVETGLVEANLTNPKGGDGSSVGWRQETAESYPNANRMNVRQSAKRFVQEASKVAGQYKHAGDLAQAVQRSAYPDRYNQRSSEASQLVRLYDKATSKSSGGSGAKVTPAKVKETTTPGVDNSAQRQQILRSYVTTGTPGGLLGLASQLGQAQDVPAKSSFKVVDGKVSGGKKASPSAASPKAAKGTKSFQGKQVAAWIEPILAYARAHGWKGTVNSGYRSYAEQTRIYNSGVRPAAKPGTSNHEGSEFPRGAVDVSNAEQLSRILAKSPYKHLLVWAGGKDPVHFSHPHGGSY